MEEISQKTERSRATLGDVLVPLLLAVFMGFFTGSMVFGSESAARIAFNKDVAIALFGAVGTWVVGFGAWYYARQAHKLRLDEIRREHLDQVRRSAESFNAARGAVIACMLPYQILSTMKDHGNFPAPAIRKVLQASIKAAPSVDRLLGVPAMARDEYMARAITLAGLLNTFVALAEQPATASENHLMPAPPWVQAEFRTAVDAAKSLSEHARKTSEFLDSIRAELQEFD